MEEFGIYPITHWPADHPKVADGVCADGSNGEYSQAVAAGDPIASSSYWSATGDTAADSSPPCELVSAGVAFYAYSYPALYSSNAGLASRSMLQVYLVQDTDEDKTYMLIIVDKPDDHSGGSLTMSLQSNTAVTMDFVDDPVNGTELADTYAYETVSSVGGRNESWMFNFNWGREDSDGVVIGPLDPRTDFKIDFQVHEESTSGLGAFTVGSYSAEKNAVDYPLGTVPLKHAQEEWGGVSIESMECTDYCQAMYEGNCEECVADERCQFARLNGGCVSAGAYVQTNGCPAPPDPPQRMYSNVETPYAYGRTNLKFKIRRPDKLNFICPCVYHYYVVVYKADDPLAEVAVVQTDVREAHRFAYAEVTGLEPGTEYVVHAWICSQDECGTYPLMSTHTTNPL